MSDSDWTAATAVALDVLRQHQGLAPLRAFRAADLSALQVAAILARGAIERPRKGWYLDPALPWQARLAARVGGVATCVSSAQSWGLPVPPDEHPLVHVGLAPNASRLRHSTDKRMRVFAGQDHRVRWHWNARVEPVHGWRASLLDTLLQLADCVPVEWFVAALDAALHVPRGGAPLLSAAGFEKLAKHLPDRLLPALDLVDPLSGSCTETLLRLGLLRRGIGPWVLQFSPTTNRFVDFLLPGKLIVEADSDRWHDPVADAERDALFRALGYRVLRFSYERIVFDLEGVLDEIAAELAR
ncbi:endonuclease domain-containing protein [Amnibacterium sp.]|uniref:endonuclease domain-containing protein n=1 Tax=Amnibacterium sp. TaxID=1872496 RepID=UPI003F7B7EC3